MIVKGFSIPEKSERILYTGVKGFSVMYENERISVLHEIEMILYQVERERFIYYF
jgi:hypothetical protein